MKMQTEGVWKINQFLVFISGLSIFVVILKFASDLLVPFLISIAIAIVLNPLLVYLQRKHIPKIISMSVVIMLSLFPLVIVAEQLTDEVRSLSHNFEAISADFTQTLNKSNSLLSKYGFSFDQNTLSKAIEKSNLGDIVHHLASQASSQLSNMFLIIFTTAFMLMESEFFYNKLIKVGRENNRDIHEWMHIITKIQSYFLIKVKTSFLTAVWALGVLWYYDVSYALLWSVLVFFLNFVPVIGSILAAIPAIVMAGIDHDMMTAFWVATWYAVINTIIGNILEPRIMGRGLGLSALVIFLSMTFWGWVFGPAGMILSVPLTMVCQFMFEQYDETRWIAFLLSDYEKETA